MAADSGKVRAEGKDFIISVNTSWNEFRNSTEQRRHFTKGDKLFLETAAGPPLVIPQANRDLEGWYFAVVPANSIATVCEVAIWTRTDIA